MNNFPKIIPIFPLSNFIIFPNTTVPLNIFEPRYLDMFNDSMKSNKLIGMIQPKNSKDQFGIPKLHDVGCLGKIRFQILNEINSDKKYRSVEVNYNDYLNDLSDEKEEINFSDLELIFKDLKSLFKKRGFIINWKALEKQSLNETINALAMASPFTLEEKQILLEAKNLDIRKSKIAEILNTYTFDNYENTTLQ